MAYDKDTPVDINERFSASQPKITANFKEIKATFDIDHVELGELGATKGKHNKITCPDTTVVPATTPVATSATEIMLYGLGQNLWFRPASQAAGTVTNDINLTGGTIGATGYCMLPSGIKLNWGTGTIVGSGTYSVAVLFSSAFSTTVYSVQITCKNAFGSGTPLDWVLSADAVGVAGFTASRKSTQTGPSAEFYYLAIGK